MMAAVNESLQRASLRQHVWMRRIERSAIFGFVLVTWIEVSRFFEHRGSQEDGVASKKDARLLSPARATNN